MPLYEYHCVECMSNFSELRNNSEMDLEIDCPECGSSKTKRFFSCFTVGATRTISKTAGSLSSSQFR